MFSKSLFTGLLAVALAAVNVQATWDATKPNNLAIYWGQNAAGKDTTQGSLASYCSNAGIDIIPVAFLTKFHGKNNLPEINLSNACGTTFPGTNVLHCPSIATDIETCQKKYGKKILLSIAGDSYSEGGWKTAAAAQADADIAWNMFATGSNKYRPFDKAIVDGFDLDFESSTAHIIDFAARLRSHMDADKSKSWMMTAAPQCPFPDPNLHAAIEQVFFDAVFVQFYNSKCGADSWAAKKAQNVASSSFNMQEWDTWAQKSARHSSTKKCKVFIGMTAGTNQPNYVDKKKAAAIIADSKRWASFAGVSLWDASFASSNSGYVTGIKAALNKNLSKRDAEIEIEEREASPEFLEVNEKRSPLAARHHNHHRRSMV